MSAERDPEDQLLDDMERFADDLARFANRAKRLARLRRADGRDLSPTTLAHLEELRDGTSLLAATLNVAASSRTLSDASLWTLDPEPPTETS